MQFPISLNQERYLFAEKATDISYALPVSFRISGSLDKDRLKKAISHLLDKHEMLRCSIQSHNQFLHTNVVHPYADARLDFVKIDTEDHNSIAKIIDSYFFQKVNYAAHELVKFQLIQLPQNESILSFSVHHIIADGVSIGIIIRDLSRFYNNYEDENTNKLSLSRCATYKEYCEFVSNKFLAESNQLKTFWQKNLAGFPENTQLLMRNAIPNVNKSHHECFAFDVHEMLHDATRNAAKSIGVSTFAFYISLFHIALSRMTNTNKVVTVFQSSGRQEYLSFGDVVGLFSNALLLATEVENNKQFDSYCKKVSEIIRSLLESQEYPYHYVTRDTGIHPSIGFNWYPIYDSLTLNGCLTRKEEIISWRSDLDLNIHCVYEDGKLSFRAYFNSEIYKLSVIELLINHFFKLIQSAVNNPNGTIKNLNSISGIDESLLPVVTHSTSPLSYTRIEDAFLHVVNSLPDNIALLTDDSAISYRQLYLLSKNVQALIEAHAKGNSLTIGILAERGVGFIVSVISSLLANCSFAILDANYPESRLYEFIDALKPDLIIAENASTLVLSTKFWRKESHVISDKWHVDLFISTNPYTETSRDIAYYLFTSGTTGTPKCISTNHAPLIHFLEWQRRTFSISESDRFSLLSGLSHDPVLRDIFAPLSVGACLCIPSDEIIFSTGGLGKWLIKKKVTVTHITPQMGKIISSTAQQSEMNDVRLCFIGGDRLRQNDIHMLRSVMQQTALINVYGASETPQVMGYYVVPNAIDKLLIPIGKGIDDVELLVQSEKGVLAGIGEYGQIVVRTRFLSNGYKNDPDSNHFNCINGQGEYLTGDFGFYDENGNVVFIGRGDDQLKIRGYRVEPADIEVHVESMENVDRALVIPYCEDNDEKKLICYIQLVSAKNLSREDIHLYLSTQLPKYMLPSAYVFLDKFPLFPNGKINRSALPMPMEDHSVQRSSYVAPSTKREKELVAMWEKALGMSPIGIQDSFYDVGGNSLTAISLMIEMERLGISDKDCRIMFQGGTIADIAREPSDNETEGRYEKDKPVEFITNLLLNCLRGFLVLLVVAGHWFPGLLERVPENIRAIKSYVTPVFNLSTPGFSIVFGITLGFSLFNTYKQQNKRFYHQLKMGVALLLFGLMIRSFLSIFIEFIENDGANLTSTYIATSFYNVLGFYLLAMGSLPLWFRFIEYKERVTLNVLILITFFILIDFIIHTMLWSEQEGVLQLIRLYLVAKFSYFNLAAGSLMGFLIGYRIKKNIHNNGYRFYLKLGVLLTLVGIFIGVALGDIYVLTEPSKKIYLWMWLLYLGVINVIIFNLWKTLKNYNKVNRFLRESFNILSLFGVIALPMFVFHGVVLVMKDTLDVLGVPDLIGLTTVLSIFFGSTYFIIRRLYRLYF